LKRYGAAKSGACAQTTTVRAEPAIAASVSVNFDPVQPFVLLDDARRTGAPARLFTGLTDTIVAHAPADVAPALARLRGDGAFAGFIGFEAGYAIEPKLAPLARTPDDGLPLLWFGRFARHQRVDAAEVIAGGRAWVGAVTPEIDAAGHAAMVAEVAALIAAGDIYQANITFQAHVAVGGHPLALYRRIRAAQAAPYGALIHTGERWILSFSPELFFSMRGRALTARPMKGTAPRGPSATEDAGNAAALAADPKNRAENLMIVDLLRNDLSRVSGTISVDKLFHVEHYPTVLQMTSTVTATAHPYIGPADVLATIFPCGSVTGAPKIRAMEVIAATEPRPRGLYTGSIGYIDGADAVFNVAIRTLVLMHGGARIGLGSGIVADSEPASEWAECVAKGAFLQRIARPADIIETMRYENGTIAHLGRHLARAGATAAYLDVPFDAPLIAATLDRAINGCTTPQRVRLLIGASGAVAVEVAALPPALPEPVTVPLAPLPVAPTDWRLAHKTTDRSFYDDARRAAGTPELVFVRPDGLLTEGSFTNIFVERDGVLLTPRASHGLLPGILRGELLDTGRAVEADLTVDDLGRGFLIGNALRGLVRARLG
jgi:para-aminobenzoate synthetase / 4-amino-4-deoxychorismate lyase